MELFIAMGIYALTVSSGFLVIGVVFNIIITWMRDNGT